MLSLVFLAGQLVSPVLWFRLPHARYSFRKCPSWKIRPLSPHINTFRVRSGSIGPFVYMYLSAEATESGISFMVIFSRLSSGDNCFVITGFLSKTSTEAPLILICLLTQRFNLAGRSVRFIRYTPRIF